MQFFERKKFQKDIAIILKGLQCFFLIEFTNLKASPKINSLTSNTEFCALQKKL